MTINFSAPTFSTGNGWVETFSVQFLGSTTTPEPGTVSLLLGGLALLGGYFRVARKPN